MTLKEIRDATSALEQQARQHNALFDSKMQQDSLEAARLMDQTRLTFEAVGEGYDLSEFHEYPNVMADPQAVMRELQVCNFPLFGY